MRVDILSILPGTLHSYLQEGMIGRAIREGRLDVNVVNVRDFAPPPHRQTDDGPYGGGPGQVMRAAPLAGAVRSVPRCKKNLVILLSAQGARFNAKTARRLAGCEQLILVCGRYEGVDQRFIDRCIDEELSIGDYVLTGGELPALVVLDAVARFVPGVLGNEQSAENDSFTNGLLEYPHYTKPQEFEGLAVPQVLLSGDHAVIAEWRRQEALRRTRRLRPDLLTPDPAHRRPGRATVVLRGPADRLLK
ncbi:MAG: tRNA (guanosine(37)-N1)-methyltransferase TrmD [Myxococcales bacterium]|nr:MAG: tRNA (guanosine(37)-N1)-methyltransferase TrmD [Myxococcales bacterium]